MTTATPKKEAKKTKPETPEFVTVAQFNQLTDVIGKLVDKVDEISKKEIHGEPTKEQTEVAKAKYNEAPMNPAWEEKAREIIGEPMDRCEVFYPKAGGQIFTVVIKSEFSNAPKEYMERMKEDRRSREIGNEGIAGVETWCKLIKANLKRGN